MTDLMAEGLGLALYGLGTVFVFLTFLVGATILMSFIALKLDPVDSPPAEENPDLLAASVAAVKAYRKRHGDG
ncbi:MAG: OadG family protein [Pseudomonadales bacterium]|nr:OadG family protein [Pseudomonadales bacterium]